MLALLAISWPMIFAVVKYLSKTAPDDITYNKPNLTGIVISDEKPELTRENWFSGSYQRETDDYNNDHWAMKEKMVRLNNQLYFSAFNQIRVNGFVMGKENTVFSENYIFAAYGDDLLNEEKIASQMKMAKVVQDTLKKKGINLVLGFAPGKGMYFREYIEDKYKHPYTTTNYELYKKHAWGNGLQVLDLYDYFLKLKPESKYPLFTRFGHHWSYYGECIATQTIIEYLEKLRGEDLPDLTWDGIDVVDTARSRDADILKSMNLYSNPPQNMKLAYPRIQFESDSVKNKTRVLVIGDSYWYGPVYMGVPQNCFAGGEFWYYYNRIVPKRQADVNIEVWELDLKAEIERNKVILLMYSDGNLPSFGNAFIKDAYELYTSPKTYYERNERNKQIQTFAKQIRNTPALLKKATAKSNDLQITVDSAIKTDAMRMAGMLK